jgi:type I restriction enzyme S subunit
VSELPPGWTQFSISDVGGTVGGKTPSKAVSRYWTPPELPWASPKDMKVFLLKGTEDRIARVATTEAGMNLIPTGSVLMVTRSGILAHTFPVAIARVPMTINQDIKAILPNPLTDERYLAYAIRAHERQILHSCSKEGTTVASVETPLLERLPLPLAPLSEQERIADKLDTLLARVDACRERIGRIQGILKRFRQAILAAATSGELTREWREARGLGGDVQSFPLEDAEAIRDFTFPASWSARRLVDIATITGGVTKDSKKQSADFVELPYLRVANVQRGHIDLSEVKTIRVPPERVSDLLLRAGDILFNEGGDIDKLGRGWIWNDELPACVFQNHVFRARLLDPAFEPRYFSWYGNSRGYEYFLAHGKQTTNLASINKSVLSALPVAVPPADEQAEIVRRASELLQHADALERHCRHAAAQVVTLTPSTLAKAFRGELVPQNSTDEPASALLEKVKTAKANAVVTPSERRSKTPGGRQTMSHTNKDSIKAAILNLKSDRFSFDELRALVSGDYESLKVALFELLEEPGPVIKQVFDKKAKVMQLVRVRP